MRVKLASNFRQPYDPFFDRDGEVTFRRFTTEGPNRWDALKVLKAHGISVPAHGSVSDIYYSEGDPYECMDRSNLKLVVHTDETAHSSHGKILLDAEEAFIAFPGTFCTVYHETSKIYAQPGKAVSLRYLSIGKRRFWLKYIGDHPWRSNIYPSIEVVKETDLDHKLPYPLYAIDFVMADTDMLAVDFNIAPGITGTGIEEHISWPEVAKEITEWFNRLSITYQLDWNSVFNS